MVESNLMPVQSLVMGAELRAIIRVKFKVRFFTDTSHMLGLRARFS